MFLEIEIAPSTLSLNCPWVALLRPLIPDSGIVVPIPTFSLIIAVPITSSSSLGKEMLVVPIPTLVPNTPTFLTIKL